MSDYLLLSLQKEVINLRHDIIFTEASQVNSAEQHAKGDTVLVKKRSRHSVVHHLQGFIQVISFCSQYKYNFKKL